MDELTKLRVTVARLAQLAGVDNGLSVTGKGYKDLVHAAQTEQRGWNDLIGRVMDKLEALQEADRRAYHEGEANATPEPYQGSYDEPILEDKA